MAVAARDKAKAKAFAELHQVLKFYGSYEELAEDKKVEFVYGGTINTLHLNLGKMMIDSSKHLLVEKPLTCTLKGTLEMIDLARQKSLSLRSHLVQIFANLFSSNEKSKKR